MLAEKYRMEAHLPMVSVEGVSVRAIWAGVVWKWNPAAEKLQMYAAGPAVQGWLVAHPSLAGLCGAVSDPLDYVQPIS